MAKYGLVAGDRGTKVLKDVINGFEDMEVTYTPYTMENMLNELTKTGGIHLQDLKAVMILDFAFEFDSDGGEDKVAKEFVAIQDLMRTHRLENVVLYLVTKNTDLYEKLKGNIEGIPGVYFESVQVLLIKNDYKPALLRSVLLGERDNSGLYNNTSYGNISRKERLQEERDLEIARRRNLSDEIVKFDKNEPVSVISDLDFIDSQKREAAENQKRKDAALEQKRREREERKGVGQEGEPDDREDVSVNIYTDDSGGGTASVGGGTADAGQSSGIDQSLFEMFNKIKNVRTDVAKGKIETDTGVISIVGDYNAGGSGVVANMAEMYALAKRKVLVVDLDIQNRMQTVYFSQYDKVVENQRGASDSLIEVIRGYGIKESVVPLTKWLHVLSVSREDEVSLNWISAITRSIEALLIEAKEQYDVIILDIPFRFFRNYMDIFDKIDRNVFVVENKFYKVENFIENILHPILLDETVQMEDIIVKSNIILNKFVRGQRDLDGSEINRRYMRKVLDGIGYPYDNMGVAGEIPHYDLWEEQFFTGVRHVWTDAVSLGVYRRVFGKVVI